jgi:tetratricopeptide (TPR) repeat protein
MTRIVLLTSAVVFSMIMAGCEKPQQPKAVITSDQERALVSQVLSTRQNYAQALQTVVDYYSRIGNQQKLDWAIKELAAVKAAGAQTTNTTPTGPERDLLEQLASYKQTYIESLEKLVAYYSSSNEAYKLSESKKELDEARTAPQYSYVVEAEIAGPDLRAMAAIPEANKLYQKGLELDNQAYTTLVITDEKKARQALDKYNQLIKQYPTSDKIGMAAYKAGRIYEDLGDYAIGAIYLERAAQWDKNVPFPARFRAAYVNDKYLNNKAKALLLYQDSLAHEFMNSQYRAYANNRVIILSKKEME